MSRTAHAISATPQDTPAASRARSLRSLVAIVLVFAAAVVCGFWWHTGLDMYPLDDGWAGFAAPQHFSWTDFLFSNRRELRKVPFIIAQALEQDGFTTINTILIGIDILIWTGLFVVLYHVFRKRPLEAFIASALVMLFPNDPTMFWLGAFGVNSSYLLLLWSTAFSFLAIDRNKPSLHVPALLLFFFGVKTYAGFIALPPILVAYLLLRDRPQHPIRRLLKYLTPHALILAIAVAPVLFGAPSEGGRDSRVASFDPALALKGYGKMLENLGYGWADKFFTPAAWMLPYAVYFGLLVAAAMLLLARHRRTGANPITAESTDLRATVIFVGMCVAVIVFGYLPFSVSQIRFNADRALMASRIGFVCLLVAAASHAARRFSPRPLMPLVAVAAGTVVVVFAVNKLSVFDERHERSMYQRVLLSDLAATMPCARSKWPVLLHTAPREFTQRRGGQFLALRPELALRTLYAKRNLKVFTLNDWTMSARPTSGIDRDHVRFGKNVLGPGSVIFQYSFKDGLRPLPNLTIHAGQADEAILTGRPLPAGDCETTPLVQSLLRDRAGYLQHLGLTR